MSESVPLTTYPVLLLRTLLTNLTLAPLDSRLCVIGFPPPPHFSEDDEDGGGGAPEFEDVDPSGGDDAALVDDGMGIGGLAGI